MAYINQKTWNLISILFACVYLVCVSFSIIDLGKHAILMGFFKAIPIWMSAILSMVGNDSVLGVALVFGSTGDIMFDIRRYNAFKDDTAMCQHMFQMGLAFFFIQHIIVMAKFITFWKVFRIQSLFAYFMHFIAFYFFLSPMVGDESKFNITVYGFALITNCFLALNALSPSASLKHERFNLYATSLFWISDALNFAMEHRLESLDRSKNMDIPPIIAMINATNPAMIEILKMICYYSAQILFANGAYNLYRYNRSMLKRR